ncbi:uncharacterized protein LOC133728749 [Rosa rugosa]|uniref:uncharacterized protein LOC133728749 n=1 Tax=Rosa rugosa TaxID=74645 RepID=UPI002B4058C9|nr:uncharacterized protein LOC133728749 [Rosa rugosa]
MEDYFVERPVFKDWEFRARYRMSHIVFYRISGSLCRYDRYFVQKSDAAKKVGLLPEQKMTCSLQMLAYGAGADQCAEYCRMAKSTFIEALQRFTRGNVNLYSEEYLWDPTAAYPRKLLAKAQRKGFLGMIGSIDCMHWQWKNCPTGWAGDTVVENISSLSSSKQSHHTAHGYGTPSLECPEDAMTSTSWQSPRCLTSLLLSRFSIVRGDARGWDIEDLLYIMLTCIILHNMIVEDEQPEDCDEDLESDEEEENNMRPRLATVWDGLTGDDFDPVGTDGHNLNGFMDR